MKHINTMKALSVTALLLLAEGVSADPGGAIAVSEPSTFALMALGLTAVLLSRKAK